jgi:hypothetical protein
MQGETLESCKVDAPALIEASPDILDALVLDKNVVISVASDYIPKPSDDRVADQKILGRKGMWGSMGQGF